jgi:secreted PhoX family phosphatase
LQVLTLAEGPNYNADLASQGQRFGLVWQDVDPNEPHESAEDVGATRFNRLEGAYFASGVFWFDDTLGGEKRLGQIFRYLPSSNTLKLFYEETETANPSAGAGFSGSAVIHDDPGNVHRTLMPQRGALVRGLS